MLGFGVIAPPPFFPSAGIIGNWRYMYGGPYKSSAWAVLVLVLLMIGTKHGNDALPRAHIVKVRYSSATSIKAHKCADCLPHGRQKFLITENVYSYVTGQFLLLL